MTRASLTPTPAQGVPAASSEAEQAVYDERQDARAREHSQHLHALDERVAALYARAVAPSPVQWPRVVTGVLTAAVVAGLGVLAGMRDTVHDNAGRVTALERAQQESAIESRAEAARRLTDDRSSRDTLAAIQSDLRALRVQVDLALSQREDEADDAPARHRHR